MEQEQQDEAPPPKTVEELEQRIADLQREMNTEQEGAFLFMAALVRKLGGEASLTGQDLLMATQYELARAETPDGGFTIKAVKIEPESVIAEHKPVLARVQ